MNVNVINMHYAGNTWLTETGLKEIVPVELWGGKKFSSSAKVFTQRCVIKQERWPTKASNGCSLKVSERERHVFLLSTGIRCRRERR